MKQIIVPLENLFAPGDAPDPNNADPTVIALQVARRYRKVQDSLAAMQHDHVRRTVEEFRAAVEKHTGCPIRVVQEGSGDGPVAQVQLAWQHQRDHHLIRCQPSYPTKLMPHLLAHEILSAWELEMDKPGDLASYTLKTQHSAIRGYNFYQRIEPYYSNFMRLINELAKEPDFEVYPLASHLTYPWLGGNLRLPNQRSEAEAVQGANFQRSYYLQQLDWSMGVYNLWNTVEFRRGNDLEGQLDHAGTAFHQMRPQLRHDVHLFQRPLCRASFWPDFDPAWLEFDRTYQAEGILPKPQER